jgi:hypothetical protein
MDSKTIREELMEKRRKEKKRRMDFAESCVDMGFKPHNELVEFLARDQSVLDDRVYIAFLESVIVMKKAGA